MMFTVSILYRNCVLENVLTLTMMFTVKCLIHKIVSWRIYSLSPSCLLSVSYVQNCILENVLTLTMIFTVIALYRKLCLGECACFNHDVYSQCLVTKHNEIGKFASQCHCWELDCDFWDIP